jgi:hypothetical protein
MNTECSWGSVFCWLYNWQTLITAAIGFAAAVVTVLATLWYQWADRRQERADELEAIKQALGAEVRHLADHALLAFRRCMSIQDDHSVDWFRMAVRMPNAIIYPAVASKIGFLGDEAHVVVEFFAKISSAQEIAERSSRHYEGEDHEKEIVEAGILFRDACDIACLLLSPLRASAKDDQRDANFLIAFRGARSGWWDKYSNPATHS